MIDHKQTKKIFENWNKFLIESADSIKEQISTRGGFDVDKIVSDFDKYEKGVSPLYAYRRFKDDVLLLNKLLKQNKPKKDIYLAMLKMKIPKRFRALIKNPKEYEKIKQDKEFEKAFSNLIILHSSITMPPNKTQLAKFDLEDFLMSGMGIKPIGDAIDLVSKGYEWIFEELKTWDTIDWVVNILILLIIPLLIEAFAAGSTVALAVANFRTALMASKASRVVTWGAEAVAFFGRLLMQLAAGLMTIPQISFLSLLLTGPLVGGASASALGMGLLLMIWLCYEHVMLGIEERFRYLFNIPEPPSVKEKAIAAANKELNGLRVKYTDVFEEFEQAKSEAEKQQKMEKFWDEASKTFDRIFKQLSSSKSFNVIKNNFSKHMPAERGGDPTIDRERRSKAKTLKGPGFPLPRGGLFGPK